MTSTILRPISTKPYTQERMDVMHRADRIQREMLNARLKGRSLSYSDATALVDAALAAMKQALNKPAVKTIRDMLTTKKTGFINWMVKTATPVKPYIEPIVGYSVATAYALAIGVCGGIALAGMMRGL